MKRTVSLFLLLRSREEAVGGFEKDQHVPNGPSLIGVEKAVSIVVWVSDIRY